MQSHNQSSNSPPERGGAFPISSTTSAPRSCLFLRESPQRVWVQRPRGWMAGLARRRWLDDYFGAGIAQIASPAQWAQLKEQLPLRSLSEHEGSYREREEPPMRSADEE